MVRNVSLRVRVRVRDDRYSIGGVCWLQVGCVGYRVQVRCAACRWGVPGAGEVCLVQVGCAGCR
jgi:hypothetical protein